VLNSSHPMSGDVAGGKKYSTLNADTFIQGAQSPMRLSRLRSGNAGSEKKYANIDGQKLLEHHANNSHVIEMANLEEVTNGIHDYANPFLKTDEKWSKLRSNPATHDTADAHPDGKDAKAHDLASIFEALNRQQPPNIGRDGREIDSKAQEALLEKDDDDSPSTLKLNPCTRLCAGCKQACCARVQDHACAQHVAAGCSFFCGELARNPMCGPIFQALSKCMGLTGKAEALFEMTHGIFEPVINLDAQAFGKALQNAPINPVLGIKVWRTDQLKPVVELTHPMVRIYCVDIQTGQYWPKSDPSRIVMFPMENRPQGGTYYDKAGNRRVSVVGADDAHADDRADDEIREVASNLDRTHAIQDTLDDASAKGLDNSQVKQFVKSPGDRKGRRGSLSQPGRAWQPVHHILPVLTKPAYLKQVKRFYPVWNEDIMFNEPLEKLLKPNLLLLFEVLDFGRKVSLDFYPDGFYPVAWGFLRAVSRKGRPNLGPRRLQLFQFSEDRPHVSAPNVPSVYYDYVFQRNVGKTLYPSSLYVALEAIAPPVPKTIKGFGLRPNHPSDRELGRIEFEFMRGHSVASDIESGVESALRMTELAKRAMARKRMQHERCIIPSKTLHTISCAATGVYCLAFSPSGQLLACACGESLGVFTIKLFLVESGSLLYTFSGHHDLIYELNFSTDSSLLVSASSDSSAKVWQVNANDTAHMDPESWRNLQHTSFVYTAVFKPELHKGGFPSFSM
jgi:hypothetical protein